MFLSGKHIPRNQTRRESKTKVILISTIILIYQIDAFLVGVSFFALKERLYWSISRRTSLLLLFMVFAFLEYYILPVAIVLDLDLHGWEF